MDQFEKADEMLSSAKSQNLAALREANRQVRIAGRGLNFVLVVVEGLRCRQLACYGKAPAPAAFGAQVQPVGEGNRNAYPPFILSFSEVGKTSIISSYSRPFFSSL